MPNTTPSTPRQPYVHHFLWEGFEVHYAYLDAFETAYGSLAGKYLLCLARPERDSHQIVVQGTFRQVERIAIKTIANILNEEF